LRLKEYKISREGDQGEKEIQGISLMTPQGIFDIFPKPPCPARGVALRIMKITGSKF
jgi:hypothetical protein